MESSLREWVALGVAIYAALVSTGVGIWVAFGIWRDRVSVKVEVKFGYPSASIRGAWQLSSPKFDSARADQNTRLIIEATNIGRRPITLNGGGVLYKDGTFGWFSGDGLRTTYPIALDEGRSGSTWINLFDYRDSLTQDPPTWAAFRSEAGKIYKTKLSKDVLNVLRNR